MKDICFESQVHDFIESTDQLDKGMLSKESFNTLILSVFFLKSLCEKRKSAIKATVGQNSNHNSIPQALEERLTLELGLVSVPEEFDFKTLVNYCDENDFVERIITAFRTIESNDLKLENIFSDSINILNRIEANNNLSYFCKQLFLKVDGFFVEKSEVDSEHFSILFNMLVEEIYKKSPYNAQIIKTPKEISKLLAGIVKPSINESIYDPACGTGSILMECINKIKDETKVVDHFGVYGQEISMSNVNIARMSFILNDVDVNLYCGDTIYNPHFLDHETLRLKKFDVVISNPPFSSKINRKDFLLLDPFNRFQWGVPSTTNADYVFVSHMLSSMKENVGRMAIVMPHGVLFRGSSEAHIRQNIIKDNLLDCIIALPQNLLLGTSIPTVILFFSSNKVNTNVMFIDASKEFKHEKRKNTLTEEGIQKILFCFETREEVRSFSRNVSLDEIIDNEFNLNMSRYIEVEFDQHDVDVDKEMREFRELENNLLDAVEDMRAILSERF